MNVKDHAKNEHAASETYHLHKAEGHRNLSKTHARLADALAKAGKSDLTDGDEAAECHRELSEIHKAMASVEGERADHHRTMASLVDSMEENQRYARAAGGDGLVPTEIRAVIPSVPSRNAPDFSKVLGLNTLEDEGLTLVPRAGQPIQQKPIVSTQFEDLVKIGDDED